MSISSKSNHMSNFNDMNQVKRFSFLSKSVTMGHDLTTDSPRPNSPSGGPHGFCRGGGRPIVDEVTIRKAT